MVFCNSFYCINKTMYLSQKLFARAKVIHNQIYFLVNNFTMFLLYELENVFWGCQASQLWIYLDSKSIKIAYFELFVNYWLKIMKVAPELNSRTLSSQHKGLRSSKHYFGGKWIFEVRRFLIWPGRSRLRD